MSRSNRTSPPTTRPETRCWLALLLAAGLMLPLATGCEGEPAPAPEAGAEEPEPDAPPEPEPDPDEEPRPDPAEEPEDLCPETARAGDPCAEDGLSCDYPKNECPCGDPSIYYTCQDGVFGDGEEEFGCEYAADSCNPAGCRQGPGGACPTEGESCWFEDGVEPHNGWAEYRRWQCTDGVLEATDETHVNGI